MEAPVKVLNCLPRDPGLEGRAHRAGGCEGDSEGPVEGHLITLGSNRPLDKMRRAQSVPSMFLATDPPQALLWKWDPESREAGRLGS